MFLLASRFVGAQLQPQEAVTPPNLCAACWGGWIVCSMPKCIVSPPTAPPVEDEQAEVSAMERRMELLPRWLFSTPTRLQHLCLHGATTFGSWPGQLLVRVSRLRALETASFEFMHIDGGVVASLARLPRLRELELGMEEDACWPWVAPLRSCSALTRLALVVRDSCSCQRVASQAAQVGWPNRNAAACWVLLSRAVH